MLDENENWVRENVGLKGKIRVDQVQTFCRTAPFVGEPGTHHSPCQFFLLLEMNEIANEKNSIVVY